MRTNSIASAHPMMPHSGNVQIHVRTMLPAMSHLTARRRFAAPTPMMAVVFVCVVETGMPVSDANSRHSPAASEAANPWYFSKCTMSMATDLMIF